MAPSSATKTAMSSAGSVVLAFSEMRWIGPGGSKKLLPTLKVYRGSLARRCALGPWPELVMAPLDPFPQNLVDTRLPTGTGRSEVAQHLWR